MRLCTSLILRLATAAVAAGALALPVIQAGAEEGAKDFSPAERALFMSDQFTKVRPPQTLHYRFRKTGSLEPGFDDQASITVKPSSDGKCCSASGEFLSGARRVQLPPVEGTEGNPVTMYFLERDIHEMQRLTKGQSNYFRKRIRMAVYQAATLRDVSLPFRGKTVAGREITIAPYVDDPNRAKFETLATKEYVFTLSDAVPGGVYAIRTVTSDSAKGADAPPLLAEELLLDGADTSLGKPGS
jgi:hypothetical protein